MCLCAEFCGSAACHPCVLQDALTKAAGKKSKTPVQLDLGDMLAALERQQQAMKARQLTNTKPLSYTGAQQFHVEFTKLSEAKQARNEHLKL